MKTARTPDERFENLDGYDFKPHYTEVHDAAEARDDRRRPSRSPGIGSRRRPGRRGS